MAEKNYQLKDTDIGFYDPETRLKIVRDQVVAIDKNSAGKKTLKVINAGGLIEVSEKPKAASDKKAANAKDKTQK